MAKDKDKSRKFDLDKGVKRQFNLDKGTKHSFNLEKDERSQFNLSKDDNEETAISQQHARLQQPTTGSIDIQNGTDDMPVIDGGIAVDNPNSNKKKWIIIALIVIVVGIVAWLLFGKGKSKDVTESKPAIEQTEKQKPGSTTDTTTTDSTNEVTPAASAVTSNQKKESASGAQSVSEEPLQTSGNTPRNSTSKEMTPSTQTGNMTEMSLTLDEQARKVIRGDFGNGKERKQKLGNRYDSIQKRVNEMYKEGLVM